MDMDMDIAWCLNCSKRTADPSRAYCSEACRLQETEPLMPPSGSTIYTAPVPLHFNPSPVLVPTRSVVPPGNKRVHRPSVTPLFAPLPPASVSMAPPEPKIGTRDRRAFSFPATHSSAPVLFASRQARPSSNALPPFVRKPNATAVNSVISPALVPTKSKTRPSPKLAPLARSTEGPSTLLEPDTVFCSTSESSDNEPEPIMLQPHQKTTTHHRSSFPAKLGPPEVTLSRFSTRKASQSPVAALVASSASSRSREDIISWARAVGVRPDQGDISDEEPRGRRRTRPHDSLGSAVLENQHLVEEHDEGNAGAGTTPKGRIGSAFAGFTIGGLRPIVKALTAVSTSVNPPELNTAGLGLQTVPSPATVSRVAVIASTAIPEDPPASSSYFMAGATPTLSTISFSEAMDPSVVTDNAEHDAVTDDQQSSSSYFGLRLVTPAKKPSQSQLQAPLRPIVTSVTAIKNLGDYLRSFAPFSFASVIPPYAPVAAAEDSKIPSSPAVFPVESSIKSLQVAAKATPMPARQAEGSQDNAPRELVRSVPMDIILPVGGLGNNDERVREREVRNWLDRSGSRSKSRARSRSRRSPSRAYSREGDDRGKRHDRQWSYDADASGDDAVEPTRGRSRRGKALHREVKPRLPSGEGVTRRSTTSRDSSGSRPRGRGRTVRAL